MRGHSRAIAVGVVLILFALLGSAAAEPRRVLLLHSFGPYFAPWNEIAGRFREGLLKQSPYAIDLYEASLQIERFEASQDQEPFLHYLRELFAGRNLDLVVAMGAPAARFFLRNRARLFPYTPLLITGTDERTLRDVPQGINDTVVGSTFNQAQPVEHILRVLPDTAHISVIIGDTPIEKFWLAEYHRALQHLQNRVTLEWLNGLSIDDIARRVAELPPRSAIYYAHVHVDARGVPQENDRVLSRLHEVASAPIFGFIDSNLGHGIVGGPLLSTRRIAEQSTTVAIQILGGTAPRDIKTPALGLSAPAYDWRELKRWKISEAGLPAGSIIEFREPTAWERYRWQLIGIFLALVCAAGIIGWLLVERRARRTAELEARQRLFEVMHLNRTAEAGALSASFAHELSQPLEAAMLNAETVERLLTANPPERARAKAANADTQQAIKHAAQLIQHLKKLLKRGSEPLLQEFNLNEAVADALHLLSPEAAKRRITLSANGSQQTLPVRADRIHIQQVVLSLATNAMDAMIGSARDARAITIQTSLREDSQVEVSVTDSGTGIPKDKLGKVFDTFYTTKKEGTGLGLSIARTIVENYGGRIWAENRIEGGAVFRFTLPLLRPGVKGCV
jgi:signal transduction histidine kinase